MERIHTRQQKILAECRLKGMCCYEIAHLLGKDPKNVRRSAEKIGMPFTEEEKQRSLELSRDAGIETRFGTLEGRKEHQREWVKTYHPEWRHISGEIFLDKKDVLLKNVVCGHTATFSSKTVRRKTSPLLCPICKNEEKAKAAEEKKRQKAEEAAQRGRERTERFWQQDFKQRSFSLCPVCGEVVLNGNKYCSKKCCDSLNCSISKDKRIRRIGSGHRDKITLKEVYERGKGICYLCGEGCDYGDYEQRNGVFIAGNRYPSIDHVVPLSKGGTHTWDNVKLAHRICNTLKSNEVACL